MLILRSPVKSLTSSAKNEYNSVHAASRCGGCCGSGEAQILHNPKGTVSGRRGVFLCLGCNLNLGAHKASRVHTFLPVSARRPACLSTGMLRCVSRLGLRNQLRALLWLDVSLSFVPRWDTHNKLSMNSHNTVIVLSTAPPASQGLRRGQEKLWVRPGRETPPSRPPHQHSHRHRHRHP